ncbi:MAG: bifunctional histidinol-phosphatase/imidazoleglycerol-phosphate dehydratase HisB [Bacteroidales bacterium]|jgi:imidazoleglycerol-phosphate dehydratase/histidinol-phosphatase|nr:bifunctional histidinol-phosphatase/imidazoleglycerol-phosphate dehydratase HisB [Bacteroidales bacterium]
MKKVLFIDRDGTLITEPIQSQQVDNWEKLEFKPGMITWMGRIAREFDFDLVMVTNQDGLGTLSFPEEQFWPVQDFLIKTLEGEGIRFAGVFIDRSFEHEQKDTRKPGIAMLEDYLKGGYDLPGSYVIGDRITDTLLAENLGTQAILLGTHDSIDEKTDKIILYASDWQEIYNILRSEERKCIHVRTTLETEIFIELKVDGIGKSDISTGLPFFDHMLEQISKHGKIDLTIRARGDLQVDEHHTIEDVGITLGEAFAKALLNKAGIERYGFILPMDDCLAQVALDFGGRSWIVWEVEFTREKIGQVPTEMFFHFFKSFSDAARCNVNIKAEGKNEHHKIEAVFKAFAKAIKMAVSRDMNYTSLPTTKGVL